MKKLDVDTYSYTDRTDNPENNNAYSETRFHTMTKV